MPNTFQKIQEIFRKVFIFPTGFLTIGLKPKYKV